MTLPSDHFLFTGRRPDEAEWFEFLESFHERYPGATSSVVARLRTAEGENSYDVAAATLAALLPQGARVLEVGCGDALLLREVAHRRPDLSLYGIDVVACDVARARDRVPSAYIRCASFTPESFGQMRFDAIASHLVFPGVFDPQRMLEMVSQLLVPGGAFVAVMPHMRKSSSFTETMAEALASLRVRHPAFGLMVTTDPRAASDEGLREMYASEGLHLETVRDFDVRTDQRGMLSEVIRRSYPFGLLEELPGVLALANRRDDGTLLPLKQIVARKQAPRS